MKPISLRSAVLAAPLLGVLAVAYGCAPDDPTTSSTAGTSTGGSVGTAGTAPSAGTPATGGSVGTAGTPAAGGSAAGGVTGTAGTPAAGGMGGSAAGSGGSTAGGSGGSAPGGCGDTTACIDVLASGMSSFGNPGWKDSWWVTGCDQKNSNDCITNGQTCNANDGPNPEDKGAKTTESWTLGGVKGQHYKVTFKFNAVSELKRYKGGHRDKAVIENDPHNTPLDTFYRDGSLDLTNYNVVKLRVLDENGMEKRHYYMNAAPDTGAILDYEGHFTWLISYTKSIVVIGGGKIEHFVEDSNCHAIDNCGADYVNGAACPAPRKLPGGDDALTLPLKYQDPKDGTIKNTTQLTAGYPNPGLTQPWHAQAGHFKITAVEPTTDDVTKDYP